MVRSKFLEQFRSDRGGNVALLAGLLVPILVFCVGIAIDYASAASRRTKLDAIADSAVLAAVTPSMMTQSTSAAELAARSFFNAQVATLTGITYDKSNLSVTITDKGVQRTASVAYTATYTNTFSKLLGKGTTTLGGTSSSTAQTAPKMDFYLLLDTSPSMAVPATQDGINKMIAATKSQDGGNGCAFACHQSCPSCDNLGNPGGVDNYQVARNMKLTLRIDLMQQAVSDLMTKMTQTATQYNTTYRAGIYTFDYMFNVNTALTSNLTKASSNSSNLQILQTYKNGWRTSSVNDNDTNTNYDGAMSGINGTMSTPGAGSNASGDKPKGVLFFVTDGVVDQATSGGGRQQSLMDNGWCTTIKNRGLQIAVLYTTYLPLPTNGWYNYYIAPFQPQIGPTLQSCASPGLYTQVNTGGDISDALKKLFDASVRSARLTN